MTESLRIAIQGGTLAGEMRTGAGLPLIMIHGFGGSRLDWDPVIAALSPNRSLIVYDQRGFAASQGGDQPYSHAQDLLALMDSLEIAQADVCGISLGGATALNFALDHPGRVRRLVLVSPLMVGWTWSAEWIERWKAIGRAARSGDMQGARELWWAHPLFDTVRQGPAAPTMRAAIEAFHGRQWVSDPQRPALPDGDRLAALAPPTLLLTGARDTIDFRMIAEAIATLGPDVTRIDHENAGHMLTLERPTAIAAHIDHFLGPPPPYAL